MTKTITVACPHCHATLEVDVGAGVVVAHSVPTSARDKVDFDKRLRELESEKARASDRMAEAMRREQSKDRLMEDRFRKLLDEAKEHPEDGPPVRDIDLD